MKEQLWIRCPACGSKTRNKIREDTILKNYPLYCPKCKHETLIDVKYPEFKPEVTEAMAKAKRISRDPDTKRYNSFSEVIN